MKIKLLTVLSIILCITSVEVINAQWTKVSSTNVGISGRVHSFNSVLFLYGVSNKFHMYRSIDDGASWTDIAEKFPYDVYFMFNYKNEIFAVTTTLGTGTYRFYTSTDSGVNWSEKSNIPKVTGNGAILWMSADGDNLYAISNRKSFYTSRDNGLTWSETIINTTAAGNMVYLAAVGNTFVANILGTGSVVSVDGGSVWETINVESPALQITYSYAYKGSIYGTTGGSGVFKFNTSTKKWDSASSGLPDALSFQIAKSFFSFNSTLFYTSIGFLDSKPLIFSSTNGGTNWSSVSTAGLTTINGGTSNTSIVATTSNLFLYDFKSLGAEASFYKMAIDLTDVESTDQIPAGFELTQNYPNPFNPSTVISYRLSAAGHVSLKVYDMLGREVATLVDEFQNAGKYNSKFSAINSQFSSGIYFYTIKVGNFVETKKMMLLK